MDDLPLWVEQAAALPVAFAQVREDPLLDQWVVQQIRPEADVLLVASGGCTAALLATDPRIRTLHLIDPNSSQLALTRFKLWLLQHTNREQRLRLLGHAAMPSGQRASHMEVILRELNLPNNACGPPSMVAEIGPDYCGRYERLFAALQAELADCREELHAALCLTGGDEQRRQTDDGSMLGCRMREALDQVMALPILVRLFGSEATNNPVQPFARHFLWRVQHALRTLPARTNPYLWQMLRGTYPDEYMAPWLTAAPPLELPEVSWTNCCMDEALENRRTACDFVQLSNILDWLTPEHAQRTLELAWQALRQGGWTLVRQLNSTLDIPALGPQFAWLDSDADALHRRDRSFFYRRLHVGVKR